MTLAELRHSRLARRLLLLLAFLAGLGLLWVSGPALHTDGFGAAGSQDFIQYWGAARLLLAGGNPYDPVALLAMAQSAGWPESEPLGLWYPPWTLAVVLPFALPPFGHATQIWMAVQLGLVLASGLLLHRYFSRGNGRYWVGPLLAAGFVPGLFALHMGQISPWLLLGVAAFLYAERGHRDLLAGSAMSLLMIKPHVTYLFWAAGLWWIWRSRRWRILTGWLATLAIASACVLVLAPGIHGSYIAAASRPPLDGATRTLGAWLRLKTPTLGAWLRLLLGQQLGWLQFVPSLVGALTLMLWLMRWRGAWHWESTAAPLLLASTLTAAYGWSFDQLVLLPAVVSIFCRLSLAPHAKRALLSGAWALSQAGLVAQNLMQTPDFLHFWHPLVLAGLYRWGSSSGQVSTWPVEAQTCHERDTR